MKDFHLKILAIIMIIFGIFGLSTLPFLSIIVQYIDSITGFSSGNGYLTNNMDYLFKSPLIYIGGLIIPELSEPPVRTLGATIPENESHIFR